ncbi:IclR family transcriptional regulator [Rubrobacter marinus]|nr:IclR family transcriptional regulator [Rubrobacter marinus]
MEATDRKGGGVQSVDRAITVLEFLANRGWSRVTEVANELNIHKSTAYRLLTTLRDRGMVEQSAVTEKYRLGFGLVLLASAVTADLDVVRCARPICERLSEQTRETVTVAMLEGDDAVIIHQTISRSSALSADWTGVHTPLHATASGKLFLVHMPEDQRRRILRRPLERFTEHTVVDPANLEDKLREVLRDDYAFTVEELEIGLSAAGAPIRDANGSVVAAVSVSGPSFRLPVESAEEVVAPVREAAAEISQCLGFRSRGESPAR